MSVPTPVRLDAIARIVQDVADADAASATVEGMGIWILRRLELRIASTPRFRADLTARTWCSGFGARWAERTSHVHVGDVLCVESTAIWVHTDPERGAPTPLPPGFDAVWGRLQATAAKSRRACGTSPPPPDATRRGPCGDRSRRRRSRQQRRVLGRRSKTSWSGAAGRACRRPRSSSGPGSSSPTPWSSSSPTPAQIPMAGSRRGCASTVTCAHRSS